MGISSFGGDFTSSGIIFSGVVTDFSFTGSDCLTFWSIEAFSSIDPKIAPTSTVEPSSALIFCIQPFDGEGTSRVTLSVSSSSSGSSTDTESPSFLYHFATVASTTLSPREGTLISTDIFNI